MCDVECEGYEREKETGIRNNLYLLNDFLTIKVQEERDKAKTEISDLTTKLVEVSAISLKIKLLKYISNKRFDLILPNCFASCLKVTRERDLVKSQNSQLQLRLTEVCFRLISWGIFIAEYIFQQVIYLAIQEDQNM